MSPLPSKINILIGAMIPWLLYWQFRNNQLANFRIENLGKMLLILPGAFTLFYLMHLVFGLPQSFFTVMIFKMFYSLLFITAVLKYSSFSFLEKTQSFKPIRIISLQYVCLVLFLLYIGVSIAHTVSINTHAILQSNTNILILNAIILSPWQSSIIFLAALFVSSMGEELVFRYYAIEVLSAKYSRSASVILSSVIFALMHWNVEMSMFFVGLFLGYIYIQTDSVYLCTFLHFCYNLAVHSEIFYLSFPFTGFNSYFYGATLFSIILIGYHLATRGLRFAAERRRKLLGIHLGDIL